jgi:deferrochelatase/peroxidase EfeB
MVDPAMNASPDASGVPVQLDDIQGLLRHGYRNHTEACFLLLRVKDAAAARAWLRRCPVASAVPAADPPPTILQVALTSEGLRGIGVREDIVEAFSQEFIDGMAGDSNRARRLGDLGENDPRHWQWGTGDRMPHAVLLLYALPGQLAAWQQSVEGDIATGFERIGCLRTSDMHGAEPFGFTDGISQPQLDWQRERAQGDHQRLTYSNLCCLGEFLLGYPNEYGLYTPRPLVSPEQDVEQILPKAEDEPSLKDLGRNGSYLVLRQLRQDVSGFWQTLDHRAGGNAGARQRLAESMVGRTLHGQPLVESSKAASGGDMTADNPGLNAFTYESDPRGVRCPLGAHIRRSNPRNADLPPGGPGVVGWLLRTLGFDARARALDLAASTRFHRLLRRGREYGVQVPLPLALSGVPPDAGSGLHFLCLGANIARQFEFVQNAWIMGTRFNGLGDEGDPLIGNRLPDQAAVGSGSFSLPQPAGPDRLVESLPQFVTVLGGAYFFLPGIRALRFLASAPHRIRSVLNPDRPVPASDTGSAALNFVSDASLKLIQLERRFDRFVRPAFDAIARDAVARVTTALINSQRQDEGFQLAEERQLPDEEKCLDSIVSSFQKQIRGLWKPGAFERGGNTKTHGIVRAEFIVHDGLAPKFRHGIYAEPKTYRAWVRFSGPGPYITPDIDDVGFMSISVKLMGVPGPKLMQEEEFTQDMTGVSTPTFVTADVRSNAHLQLWSVKNASIFHFLDFRESHLLDLIMQGLWTKTQSSPFEAPYFSCVPYLLGEGQAMQYSFWPKSTARTPIPRLPLRPPDDYLRNAMVTALSSGDVEFDVRLQLQTDPFLMPIENNAVLWPERLSPRVSVATLRIPRQCFASPSQLAFARQLSYNPWHCIAEHRPLGNQSRARRRMYLELSTLRHQMNNVPHYEPSGDEVFDS